MFRKCVTIDLIFALVSVLKTNRIAKMKPKVVIKSLSPKLWPDLEELFGEKGACGGCWCMFWRQKRGESWAKMKGSKNKQAFRSLVKAGKVHGAIAYLDREPVGWVSYELKPNFEKLMRSPSLKSDSVVAASNTWSIPCFYILPKARGMGVGTELLEAATREIRSASKKFEMNGALIEGYPSCASAKKAPAAFVWTGVESMFAKQGFKKADPLRKSGKIRMIKKA